MYIKPFSSRLAEPGSLQLLRHEVCWKVAASWIPRYYAMYKKVSALMISVYTVIYVRSVASAMRSYTVTGKRPTLCVNSVGTPHHY